MKLRPPKSPLHPTASGSTRPFSLLRLVSLWQLLFSKRKNTWGIHAAYILYTVKWRPSHSQTSHVCTYAVFIFIHSPDCHIRGPSQHGWDITESNSISSPCRTACRFTILLRTAAKNPGHLVVFQCRRARLEKPIHQPVKALLKGPSLAALMDIEIWCFGLWVNGLVSWGKS